jgi:probable phosphoglycerate mutase
MSTVLLVRSGRTAWETEGRIQGALEIPLSPEGLAEIEQRAKEIKERVGRTIFCGADLAAVQSAQAVGRACGGRVKPLKELREMRLGLWEGLLEAEALHRNPTAYRLWRKDPLAACPPSGESAEECYGRVSEGLRRLAAQDGEKPTVLVCSRLVAAMVRCCVKDVPVSRLWEYVMPPAAAEMLQLR